MTASLETAVRVWRWRVSGDPLPITYALAFGEAARATLMREAGRRGVEKLPDSFHASWGGRHGHGFWLSDDPADEGVIRELVLFAADGIPTELFEPLAAMRRVHCRGFNLTLTAEGMGDVPEGGLFGPARAWTSVTPYVTPRWRLTKTGRERPDFTPEAQLRKDLTAKGLPAPRGIAWEPGRWNESGIVLATDHVTERRGGTRSRRHPPGDAVASFAQVEFAEPVWGPLAFGWGANFGLGLLMPLE